MAISEDVWVLLEAEETRLGAHAIGLMHEAGRLSERFGGSVNAVMLGPRIEHIANAVGARGVSNLYHHRNDSAVDYCPDAYARLLADLLTTHAPRLFLSVASSFGSDLMPRVAARVGAPLVTNCSEISVASGVEFIRPVQNGRLNATLVGRTAGTQMATVRAEALTMPEEAGPTRTAELHELAHVRGESPRRVRFRGRIKADHKTIDIRQAEFVVALGKGIGGKENLVTYEAFADLIGAAIGGTQPVVDSGILPYDRQVGQTGKKIAPKLVVLCGISGHEYFMSGIEEARAKIAINTDRRAPVFRDVDLGIVADVNALVPALMKKIKNEQ